ncbi:ATP-binding protein [Clostridioides difficile]
MDIRVFLCYSDISYEKLELKYGDIIINIKSKIVKYKKDNLDLTPNEFNLLSYLILSIENDGEYIREKDLPHVFERFYKGENGKHGIGLSIVKSIIDKHNGYVYAYNTNEGVRFDIILKYINK